MRLDSFFSGALCVLSGGRLPEALFMVFLLDSKGVPIGGVVRMALKKAGSGSSPEQRFLFLSFCSFLSFSFFYYDFPTEK